MISRLTSYTLMLLMSVPLCLCCVVAAPVKAAPVEIEACSACQKFAEPEEGVPAKTSSSDHHGNRACCVNTTERNLSPESAAAPRLVLVDLQAWVWTRSENVSYLLWQATEAQELQAALFVPPPIQAPLYQQHCALLL